MFLQAIAVLCVISFFGAGIYGWIRGSSLPPRERLAPSRRDDMEKIRAFVGAVAEILSYCWEFTLGCRRGYQILTHRPELSMLFRTASRNQPPAPGKESHASL